MACGAAGDEGATAVALEISISGTATASSGSGLDASANLKTAEAAATARSLSARSTQAASLHLSELDQTATAIAVGPILAELPNYGVDPSRGRVAWIHPPERLDVEGYLQYDYANRFIGTVVRDFVVSADIRWNTTTGLAGCGFVLRSDGNQEALNQYMVIATRGGDGRVVFSTMVDGEVKNGIDHYAFGLDDAFEWRNDSTNRLTVVGRGEVFGLYTNGTPIGEVIAGDPPPFPMLPPAPLLPAPSAGPEAQANYQEELEEYQQVVDAIRANFHARLNEYHREIPFFERGFVAMVALSESGRTVCQFDNAWLWMIEGS